MKTRVILPAATLFAALACSSLSAQAPVSQSPAGMALESIFNPQRAPAQKTMGLLQRSFLDLVEDSQQELEVAFVIDGTDSMAGDIEGVRKALRFMVEDLRQFKQNHVSFALVVYRDIGSPSGAVTVALNQFTKDEKVLAEAFSKIVPESGAPYFLELPDLGVHEALDKLNWTAGKETSRWLMLFGDAPPYDANFTDTEKNTGARRRFDTDLLIELAKRKEVQISCVLCTSRDAERKVYEQVLDRTRQFMNSLATGSGGLMLDLSYPDIKKAMIDAGKQPRVERQQIGVITRDEVETMRRAAAASRSPVAAGQRLRVAVVPHMPLDQVTFDPTHEGVQISAELRQKFKGMPQTEVKSPVDVERALRRVKSSNIPPDQWLQALAVQLQVDYVVWGSVRRAQGVVSAQSVVYSKTDGQPLISAKALTSRELPETQLVGNLVSKLTLSSLDQKKAPELHAAFAQLRTNKALNEQLITPVANTSEERSDLLTGFEALEQALAYPIGDAAGAPLLAQAEQALQRAATDDVRNPFTHLLMASCQFNLAQAAAKQGRAEEAKAKSQQVVEALRRAYRERDKAQVDLLKLEIAADHSLLVEKDYAKAIQLYEQLAAAPNDKILHTALRAHWMLSGIYTGDWGAKDAGVVDPQKARDHLTKILAHWERSAEAAFIMTHLRWSEEKGRNQVEGFPRQNDI